MAKIFHHEVLVTIQRIRRAIGLALILFASACASLPEDYPREPSMAVENYQDTAVAQLFEAAASEHPGQSGFALVTTGRGAFTTRIAFIDLAEKSIDLKYYIWHPDSTGRILGDRLIRAADRGVRVRLLVDDLDAAGRDEVIAAVASHPNIQIRLFNPVANRAAGYLDFLVDFGRVNRRMHNKAMIVDNAFAIVGGRNVGDTYFQVDPDANYRDLDIAAVGPVVREVSDAFDHFWNGPWAYPIEALVDRSFSRADFETAVVPIKEWMAENPYPYPLERDVDELKGLMDWVNERLVWAPGELVWDDPDSETVKAEGGEVLNRLREQFHDLDEEVLIESAYFVMTDESVETIRKFIERGVKIRVLTNSLASNDVLPAHAGHAAKRRVLIRNGVELYEMRADAGSIRKSLWRAESRAALHTKAMVFDRDTLFIGSFNLDPRSAVINTEAGILVESPELAAKLVEFMDEGVSPENSYRVELSPEGSLVWVTEIDGEKVVYTKEPGETFANAFLTWLIQLLPIEDQL